jgi:thioredoxin reductase (NADPH)
MSYTNHYDAIVIGAGPAGLTAGIYLSRAKVKTLVISDGVAGGQMILTHEIANYPGVENISGYQLSSIMKKQAISFGCEVRTNVSIGSLDMEGDLKYISLTDGTAYTSDIIILAPGGRSRTLGVPGEDEFKGRGISYCATCDGDFFTGKEIIVVGGGNSALEEAVSLTKYASKVTIVHQFDHFQAFEHAIDDAKRNDKIKFIMESTVGSFYGDEKLKSVDIKNLATGEIIKFMTDGAFIFIGYVPNTEFIKGLVNLNQRGEIVVNSDMQTSVEGVFAAGDGTAKHFRQITTAVSDGTIAALSASEYLNKLKIKQKLLA